MAEPRLDPASGRGSDRSQRMTIVVELPQPISNIAALLATIEAHWPDATIDTNHPDGWRIELYRQ